MCAGQRLRQLRSVRIMPQPTRSTCLLVEGPPTLRSSSAYVRCAAELESRLRPARRALGDLGVEQSFEDDQGEHFPCSAEAVKTAPECRRQERSVAWRALVPPFLQTMHDGKQPVARRRRCLSARPVAICASTSFPINNGMQSRVIQAKFDDVFHHLVRKAAPPAALIVQERVDECAAIAGVIPIGSSQVRQARELFCQCLLDETRPAMSPASAGSQAEGCPLAAPCAARPNRYLSSDVAPLRSLRVRVDVRALDNIGLRHGEGVFWAIYGGHSMLSGVFARFVSRAIGCAAP